MKIASKFSGGIFVMDRTRDQLETRIATFELMVVAERARPKPDDSALAKVEKQLLEAKLQLVKYNERHP